MLSKLGTKIALQRAGLGNLSLPKDNPFAGGNTKGAQQDGAAGGNGGFANPFANVQWGVPKAFASWTTPPPPETTVRAAPMLGEKAPTNAKLAFPAADGRPCFVLFLRYCGCPFTEKLFLQLRSLANRYNSIRFVAVSHCTQAATDAWLRTLGGAWHVDVIVDQTRELYAIWGLGISNWGHLLHPRNGYNQILLGKKEGVWGQQVGEGGCRWQVGGTYAVDARGIVNWGGPMQSVDEATPLEYGIKALGY
ncbi:uncharacterized protein K460DRAFT_321437 [Cucurbitaria berberidis CBS 394.84]|uniref:Thioredoxin domain-containing protein n=1 Tax=Cucurbitaria berberidis CBS 394.84 TaxID=1168544 RepID=A0A9P4G8X2_9PLEO|nr:uncharacterized protein K460DRAFT_321437 [Cucurbitaria berberidis CBS 394.84]KAF1840865.1 hypothetical protein K460DRAFT_321437 [Cucurbitaria berberidis CBS 394.84]